MYLHTDTKDNEHGSTRTVSVSRLSNESCVFKLALISPSLYRFMGAGGWNLVHMWLTDGILAKNWALIQELLELLLLCPVDVERLKTNNCPKLIKGLSKEGSHHVVRVLASRLVEQWLKIVKGEAAPNSVPADIMTLPIQTMIGGQYARSNSSGDNGDVQEPQTHDFDHSDKSQQQKQYYLVSSSSQQQQQSLPVYKITIRDGKQVLAKVETDLANINNVLNINNSSNENTRTNGDETEDVSAREDEVNDVQETVQGSVSEGQDNVDSEVKESVASSKDVDNNDLNGDDSVKEKETPVAGESNKSSDKENRKDDKKSSSSSSDKKLSSHSSSSSRSSSSKHSSSHRSSSHRSSSHRSGSKGSSSKDSKSSSSSKDKDKHRSSSSSGKHSSSSSSSSKGKSDRDKDREREKEKLKKDQAEKDKATLEKIQGQALTKMGKIPKKRADEQSSNEASSPSRKLSTDSKEQGSKTEAKKNGPPEKKSISMSIESRKMLESSRPKTVKTFNSKFRSTGLEEEVKPPPPRVVKKPGTVNVEKKITVPKVTAIKRPSPPRENIPLPDKRARLSLDSPTTPPPEDKKGGIKLIKPKRKYISVLTDHLFIRVSVSWSDYISILRIHSFLFSIYTHSINWLVFLIRLSLHLQNYFVSKTVFKSNHIFSFFDTVFDTKVASRYLSRLW